MTDIGIIPQSWEVQAIGDIASVKGGKRLPLGKSLVSRTTLHPYIRVTDMQDGGVSTEDIKYVPDDVFPAIKNYRIYVSDIFISVAGTLGIVGTIPLELDGSNLTENADKITDISCDRDYLLHNLQSSRIQEIIESEKTVGAQPKLALTRIERFLVGVPPTIAEQRSIAEALNDAAELIANLARLVAKMRCLRQAVAQELLSGKRHLPGFTEKWQVKSLGELFSFSGGFTASRDQLSSKGICYLHYGDIHNAKKTFIDVRSEYQDIPKLDIPLSNVPSASLLDDGDIVFVDASEDVEGASRHVVVVNPDGIPFISGLHTIVAKSRADELEHRYRRYCFQTSTIADQFKFFVVGTKVSGISKTNIAKITLPIPSISEQSAIADILSNMDAEIAAIDAQLAKTRELKQGMMQALLTGKTRLL
jgi:type I restriction enzyme S subunit